jgi:cold shock CspA family protein
MKTGQVTAFDAPRGWGWVTSSEGEKFFFHVKNSPKYNVVLGAMVSFDTAPAFRLGQRDQAINLQSAQEMGALSVGAS